MNHFGDILSAKYVEYTLKFRGSSTHHSRLNPYGRTTQFLVPPSFRGHAVVVRYKHERFARILCYW